MNQTRGFYYRKFQGKCTSTCLTLPLLQSQRTENPQRKALPIAAANWQNQRPITECKASCAKSRLSLKLKPQSKLPAVRLFRMPPRWPQITSSKSGRLCSTIPGHQSTHPRARRIKSRRDCRKRMANFNTELESHMRRMNARQVKGNFARCKNSSCAAQSA